MVALDGASALRIIEQVTPDVILLDAVMPGTDGFETCRRMKALALILPVITILAFVIIIGPIAVVVGRGYPRYMPEPVTYWRRMAEMARLVTQARATRARDR